MLWFNLRSLANTGFVRMREDFGEVAEWLKAHAWKVCIR